MIKEAKGFIEKEILPKIEVIKEQNNQNQVFF
jgi:hypothetical protein